MSDSTPPRWEQATMELRQVMARVGGGNALVVVGVQQKWLVQDGEAYPLAWGSPQRDPTDVLIDEGAHDDAYPWYAPVRAEWRDLPQIGAGEAELVLR